MVRLPVKMVQPSLAGQETGTLRSSLLAWVKSKQRKRTFMRHSGYFVHKAFAFGKHDRKAGSGHCLKFI
jgi:hypothetical protein